MNKVGLFAYGETGYSALKGLIGSFEVVWVIIPPKDINSQSSDLVERLAKEKKIEIIQTNSNKEVYNLISKTTPDLVVISSYNKILSEEVLNLTKFINIHHGDLPRWRGRANINWAIILGRKDIGLTFHEATPDLDSGNIYYQERVSIKEDDNVKTVYDKFNNIIETEMGNIVKKVLEGFKGKKQVGEGTYCCTRLPEDGLIDWHQSTQQIHNLIRGLTKPYQGAFTYLNGKRLIIWDSEIPQKPKVFEGRIPGRVVSIQKDYGVEVLTADSSIIIKNVEYDNKQFNASELITSVKNTLGINWVELYEKMQKILEDK